MSALATAQTSDHGCANPDCRSFRSPRFRVLSRNTCMTVVYDKHDVVFAYYSQKRDLLRLYRAPKPLLLMPFSAAKAGFEDLEKLVKLNKLAREGGRVARKSRRGEKLGPSKLSCELELELEEEGEEMPSSLSEGGVALPLREKEESTALLSEAPALADEAATTSAT